MKIIRRLGRIVLDRLSALKSIWTILAFSLSSFLFSFNLGRRATVKVLFKQVYFTGFQAIPIISRIALFLGLIIVTQLLNILPGLGGEGLVGGVLVWVVIREVGPLFAAVIVIARSGTAMASELGTMKIANQLSTLEIMGIDPKHYLVMPRVIGTAISLFVLTFLFNVITILGGYLLAGFGRSMTFSVYISSVLAAMGLMEVGVSLLKSLVFGLIIGTVCCYNGLMVGKSITQIPQQTTKSVISSISSIFIADAIITFIFFMR